MPTEKRSGNTDLRDVFIRLNPLGLGESELRKDSTGFEDQRTHSDYLLFLAGYRETHPEPQPHPEPIAWMVGTAFWWTKEEAERDAAATGLPMIPFGSLTGSAEIEQMREVIKHSDAQIMRQSMRISNQRAQLAERDALLAEIAKRHWSGVDFDLPADLATRIKALSASAEPEAT